MKILIQTGSSPGVTYFPLHKISIISSINVHSRNGCIVLCNSNPGNKFDEMWIYIQQFEVNRYTGINTLDKIICKMAANLSHPVWVDSTFVGQAISLIRLRKSPTRMTPGFSHSINTGTFAVCIHEQTPLYGPACWDDWFGICRSLWWKFGWRR